jgi:hypothetical protein
VEGRWAQVSHQCPPAGEQSKRNVSPPSGDKVSGWSIAILSGICLDRGAILEQVILTSELGFSSVQLE